MARALICALLLAVAGGAAAQPTPPDLSGTWAYSQIVALAERRVVDTDPDGRFRPEASLSRARFARWLVAAKGLPTPPPTRAPFPDVPASHPQAPAVDAAWRYGLLPDPQGPFRPHQALSRQDAVEWVVRALGYSWEASWLAARTAPSGELLAVAPARRGAWLVARSTRPALLVDGPGGPGNPTGPITRAEAAALLWAYLQAVEKGVQLRHEQALAPGLVVTVEKRGALRSLPVWRVQVGAFANPENAERLAARMRAQGLVAVVDVVDDLHKVRVGAFRTRGEAEAQARALAEKGLPTWVLSTVRDLERLPGPQWLAVVRLAPSLWQLRPVLARDRVPGRERTSEMARRVGALVATNGGYFAPDGDPLGGLVVDGQWASEPIPGRSCLGWSDGFALIDRLDWRGEVSWPGGAVRLGGVNRPRRQDEVVLYTPLFGASTRMAPGLEVVVSDGLVRGVRDSGPTPIPQDGYVLSGGGAALASLRTGDPVRLSLTLQPASADPRWQEVRHVVCGGPRLLSGGLPDAADEGFSETLRERRHPRTAVGLAPDGTVVLVVVDGRAPEHGLGMTLRELAEELRRAGATDVLNLDGGGSTTLVVSGAVANRPSDEGGERPVSDALVVLPRGGASPPSPPAGRSAGTGRSPWHPPRTP